MLRENGINSSTSLIGMLRGMEKLPFGPEALDTTNNNACPDLTGGLNEGNRTDIRQICRVENLGERSEEAPFPHWAARAVFPKKAGVIIRSLKKVGREGGKHVVSTARRTGRGAGGGRAKGSEVVLEGGGRAQGDLVRQEVRVGGERALKARP
jgi:hypothetical protein